LATSLDNLVQIYPDLVALVIPGTVAGFFGQVAQDIMGKYWKVFAGLSYSFFGNIHIS
jgi:hypothetical protein